MKVLISLVFLSVSLLEGVGVVQPAWGGDLKATFENEVAGVTPGMEILPSGKGALIDDRNREMLAKSGNLSLNYSRKKSPDYSASNKIAAEKRYASAGFISSDLVPVGKITKLFEEKMGTTGPDEVVVDIGKRKGIEKGDQFTVYIQDRYIYHPVLRGGFFEKKWEQTRRKGYGKSLLSPGKPVGHRIRILGVIEITELDNEFSYARVVKAYGSIETGFMLMPYKKFEDQTSAFSETDKSIEGYIVATKWDRIGISDGDFVYIDKGWEDEVRPGDHFEVYRIPVADDKAWYKFGFGKKPLIPFVMGELKIIDTQKKTATAIVVKSRIDMEIGNSIRFKPTDHPG